MARRNRARRNASLALAGLLTAACSPSADNTSDAEPPPEQDSPTALDVTEVAAGLQNPWDVGVLPDGRLLVTERPGTLTLLDSGGEGASATEVDADLDAVFAEGEGGLLGLLVHPDFAESRQFTTCQTHAEGGSPTDVRVVTWQLSEDGSSANREQTLISGMPINDTGRHSGCRMALDPDGALLVGTGDAADPNTPQDRSSLGGKVLRVDLETGEGVDDNPFADSDDDNERRIHSYGHRNVQGVAVRPDTEQVFTAEHGPEVDDEVNLLERGGNYGWDPSQGGSVDEYDENVPMTDTDRFDDAVEAVWSSGDETEGICDAEFLNGQQWGELNGALAVTALKGAKLLVFTLSADGEVESMTTPPELADDFGRLRAVQAAPDGDLYLTTDQGDDDKLLRVSPRDG